MIQGGKSKTMRTQAFLNLGAFAHFINKELVQQHNLALVEKVTPMAIEVINGQNYFLKTCNARDQGVDGNNWVTQDQSCFSMSSHLRQTLSSLGYYGSFCIILECIGR